MQPAEPIHLRASRTSLAAPLPGPGRRTSSVHSLYRAALNVATPRGLLVLTLEESGGVPNGILVSGACDFRSLGLRPGDDVTVVDGALRAGATLLVELAGAAPWSPVLPPAGPRHEAAARWRRRSTRAHRAASAHAHPRGLAAVPGAEAALHAAARAVLRCDHAAAARAAGRLVGLGPGLTPSGDDALAGVEAALHAVAHPLAGFLADALEGVDARTTAVSAALLRHASRGEFAERVHRLLAALLGDDDAALDGAIAGAAAWGATSGSDGVAGVLVGLDAALGVVAGAMPGMVARVAPSAGAAA